MPEYVNFTLFSLLLSVYYTVFFFSCTSLSFVLSVPPSISVPLSLVRSLRCGRMWCGWSSFGHWCRSCRLWRVGILAHISAFPASPFLFLLFSFPTTFLAFSSLSSDCKSAPVRHASEPRQPLRCSALRFNVLGPATRSFSHSAGERFLPMCSDINYVTLHCFLFSLLLGLRRLLFTSHSMCARKPRWGKRRDWRSGWVSSPNNNSWKRCQDLTLLSLLSLSLSLSLALSLSKKKFNSTARRH